MTASHLPGTDPHPPDKTPRTECGLAVAEDTILARPAGATCGRCLNMRKYGRGKNPINNHFFHQPRDERGRITGKAVPLEQAYADMIKRIDEIIAKRTKRGIPAAATLRLSFRRDRG